jgi:hypothetical protein
MKITKLIHSFIVGLLGFAVVSLVATRSVYCMELYGDRCCICHDALENASSEELRQAGINPETDLVFVQSEDCYHKYHRICIDGWINSGASNSDRCPYCMEPHHIQAVAHELGRVRFLQDPVVERLFTALSANDLGTIQLIINNVSEEYRIHLITAENELGYSLIEKSVYLPSTEIAEFLIIATPEIERAQLFTSLGLLAMAITSQAGMRFIEFIINSIPDTNRTQFVRNNVMGKTALHAVARGSNLTESLEIAGLLLGYAGDVEEKILWISDRTSVIYRDTPITFATIFHKPELVEFLVNELPVGRRANIILLRNVEGATALDYARDHRDCSKSDSKAQKMAQEYPNKSQAYQKIAQEIQHETDSVRYFELAIQNASERGERFAYMLPGFEKGLEYAKIVRFLESCLQQ